MEKYEKKYRNTEVDLKRDTLLKRKISMFIEKNEPIQMILPAFPCKSPNTIDRVLGVLPDKGEELAVENLNNICSKIESIFSPGTNFTIISDGIVFNDIVEVSDEISRKYSEKFAKILENTHLNVLGLDDFVKEESFAKSREKLMEMFFSSETFIENSDLQCAFTKFLKGDLFFGENKPSRSQMEKKLRLLLKK